MVAMGRALMLDPTLLLLDEPSAGLSPMLQDEVFLRCKLINDTGVAILMVEQNARRCLQVCHRGYVLDQGRNAYTGTGASCSLDPKVIELYLGTSPARPTAAPSARRRTQASGRARELGARLRLVRPVRSGVEGRRRGRCRCCRRSRRPACRSGRCPARPSWQDPRRLVEADDHDRVGVGGDDRATSASNDWAPRVVDDALDDLDPASSIVAVASSARPLP